MNPMMNPMGQRPGGSLGFPRMAPTAAPAAGNTGIVPPAPAPAVPQNVPVSVVGAPAPTPAPTGVMPMNQGNQRHHGGGVEGGGDGHGQTRIPGLVARMPGMVDLLHQFFAGGGNMRDVRQQMHGAQQEYHAAGHPTGSAFSDALGGGTGLTDYLRAHLAMPPTTGAV